MGAFVAYLATLRNLVDQVAVLQAWQFYLVRQTFVEVMRAQRPVLHFVVLHI